MTTKKNTPPVPVHTDSFSGTDESQHDHPNAHALAQVNDFGKSHRGHVCLEGRGPG